MSFRFVGQERERLADEIVAEWVACREDGRPRLVVLVGQPGSGKTRLVQEVYARLAAEEREKVKPRPPFWPARIEIEGGTLLAARGRITPEEPFRWDSGAVQTFVWQPVRCRLGPDGSPARALVEATPVARALNEPVVGDLEFGRHVLAAIGGLAVVALGIASTFLDLIGWGGWLIALFGIAVTAIGLKDVRQPVRSLTAALRHLLRRHDLVEVDSLKLIRDASQGAKVRSEEFLNDVARRGIPAVLVIDDAAWADEDTVDLIDELLQRPGQLLVVATARPDPFERQKELGEGFGRVARDFAIRCRTLQLGALDVADLETLVLERAGRTHPRVARAIAQRAGGNPLVLGALLEKPVLADTLRDEAGDPPAASRRDIDPEQLSYQLDEPETTLASVHLDYQGVFEAYWEQLPVTVKREVAIASLHGLLVELQAARSGFGAAFDREPVAFLEAARAPYYWLAREDDFLDRFTDPGLLEATKRNVHDVATAEQIEKARREMVDDLVRRRHGQRLGTLTQEAARLLLAVHLTAVEDGLSPTNAEAAMTAFQLARLLDAPSEALRSAETALKALEWADDDQAMEDAACHVIGQRFIEAGRPDRALPILKRLLELRRSTLGPDHSATLDTRANLAVALLELGRVGDALTAFEQLLADQLQILGDDDAATTRTRNNLAFVLLSAGRVEESLALFEQLVAGQQRAPSNEELTLTFRNNMAGALLDSGRVDEAVDAFKEVVAGRKELLGSDHPDTLASRNNLATALFQGGRVDEALATFEEVHAEQRDILGPDHPDTLTLRYNIADALSQLGRHDDALAALKQLLADRQRVLGANHPDTLKTRHGLATVLHRLGRSEEALAGFEQLLADQQRIITANHPDTLDTRNSRGVALLELGRADQALAAFEELLPDLEGILGADNRHTLVARNNIAESLARLDRRDEALVVFEELLADFQRLLDDDHPQTFILRSNRASLLFELGRVDEALASLEELLSDQQRRLRPNDPQTQATRNLIERCLDELGRERGDDNGP